MKLSVYALRMIESLFLVCVVFTYTSTAQGQSWSYDLVDVFWTFSFTADADAVLMSSTLLGYAVSLLATYLYWEESKPSVRPWAALLAVLGLVATGNEFLRYALGYDVQVLVIFPLMQLIIDWSMTKGVTLMKPASEQGETP